MGLCDQTRRERIQQVRSKTDRLIVASVARPLQNAVAYTAATVFNRYESRCMETNQQSNEGTGWTLDQARVGWRCPYIPENIHIDYAY